MKYASARKVRLAPLTPPPLPPRAVEAGTRSGQRVTSVPPVAKRSCIVAVSPAKERAEAEEEEEEEEEEEVLTLMTFPALFF